ncbi:hypothetical protein RN001_003549 [Aquatica leii]|uniref:Uncharacterized protein n=1 Tax=Aquatica leii TaxID=1421715 RepID=A0AAN7SRM4_9COLE|nr:hypothetical protein RN001_003549 [Aquatica leii]
MMMNATRNGETSIYYDNLIFGRDYGDDFNFSHGGEPRMANLRQFVHVTSAFRHDRRCERNFFASIALESFDLLPLIFQRHCNLTML